MSESNKGQPMTTKETKKMVDEFERKFERAMDRQRRKSKKRKKLTVSQQKVLDAILADMESPEERLMISRG